MSSLNAIGAIKSGLPEEKSYASEYKKCTEECAQDLQKFKQDVENTPWYKPNPLKENYQVCETTNLDIPNLQSIYLTQVELYKTKLKNPLNTTDKIFYTEQLSLYQSLLFQLQLISSLTQKVEKRLWVLSQNNFLNTQQKKEYEQKIQAFIVQSTLVSKKYIDTYNDYACDIPNTAKIITPAEDMLKSLSGTIDKISALNTEILQSSLDTLKKTPSLPYSVLLKEISAITSQRFNQSLLNTMVLAGTSPFESSEEGEEDHSKNTFRIPDRVNSVAKTKRHAAQLKSFYESGKSWNAVFDTFNDLANPSALSFQGIAQKAEKIQDDATKNAFPTWTHQILEFAEGEAAQKTVTEYFQEFTTSQEYKKYQVKVQMLADKNSDFFRWIENPIQYQDDLLNFMDTMKESQENFLLQLNVLTEDLLEKGVSHEKIFQMLNWVQNNLLLSTSIAIAGVSGTTLLTYKAGKLAIRGAGTLTKKGAGIVLQGLKKIFGRAFSGVAINTEVLDTYLQNQITGSGSAGRKNNIM